MINIAGRIFISLKIDGNDLPHAPNLVERITMTEGMGALSPAIELILNDYSGALQRELALTDGNEILITVGKTPNDLNTQSRQYRVFGMRQITSASGPKMQVIGIYDAPGYLTGSVRESFKGTTGEVIKQIADRCKLCYSGPEDFNGRKTDDSQVWINIAKSRAMFVQQTTRHGWIDEHSAMMTMLTSLGQLRYLNLNDVIETPQEKVERIFVHNVSSVPPSMRTMKTYTVREAQGRSSAGLMNTWQNYGSTRLEHSLDGQQKAHDKVQVKTSGNYLAINDTVKKTVDRSRIEYSPLDCGNTHRGYHKALYQNVKLLGLFSEHISILTYDVTDLQPLDVVFYRQADADPKTPVSNSDIYLVAGKSILVKGGKDYAERIELVRRSITEKGATELTCATPSKVAETAVPDSLIDPTSKLGATTLPNSIAIATLGNPVQAAFNQLKGTLPDLTKAGGFAMPGLKGLTDTVGTLRSGMSLGLQQAGQVVGQIKGAMASLNQYKNMGANFVNGMKNSVSSLTNLAAAVKSGDVSSAVRSALMFQPSGIMNSMTATLGGVRNQMQVSSILGPVNAVLGSGENLAKIMQVPGGAETWNDFSKVSKGIIDTGTECKAVAADMWNQSLSVLNGQPVPQMDTINAVNNQSMTTAMNNLYRVPASGSFSATPLSVATEDLTSVMLKKTNDREPTWLNPSVGFATKPNGVYEIKIDDQGRITDIVPEKSTNTTVYGGFSTPAAVAPDLKLEDEGDNLNIDVIPGQNGILSYTSAADIAEDNYADMEREYELAQNRESEMFSNDW